MKHRELLWILGCCPDLGNQGTVSLGQPLPWVAWSGSCHTRMGETPNREVGVAECIPANLAREGSHLAYNLMRLFR